MNHELIKKVQDKNISEVGKRPEIKVGDTWEKTYNTGGKMSAKNTTIYTVTDIDGDNVSMTTKTKIESNTGEMEMNGKQNGNIIVDSKTGLIVNSEFTQDLEVKANGVKVEITGKGKIKGKAN